MQHRPERLGDRERGGGAVVVGANGRHDRDFVRELGQELEGVGVGPVEVVDEQHAAVQGAGGRGDDLGAGAGQCDAARSLQREVGHPPQGLHRAAERGPAAELRAHRVQHGRLSNSCLTDEGARVPPTHEIEDGPDLLVAADEHGRRVVSPSAPEPERICTGMAGIGDACPSTCWEHASGAGEGEEQPGQGVGLRGSRRSRSCAGNAGCTWSWGA